MARDILYPLRRLHGHIHETKTRSELRRRYRNQFREMRKKNPKTIFLVLTPEHGNLGDHAIAYAETTMLKELGIDYFEITSQQLNQWKYQGILDVMNGFPVLINGGGNLGTLWMGVENLERTIFQKNPKSRVMVLPNTIFYEDNDWGKAELQKSVQIYNRHRHLTICARERNSYEFMKPVYQDVRLVPDMVLSLKKDTYNLSRKGCLLCLREDCEKTRTQQDEEKIRQQAAQLFGEHVTDTDMIVKDRVSVDQREQILDEKFAQFAGAELVITDRLHGMIFCAITGTPCIVINSKSPKVRGCYEWIKNLDYIRFADNPNDIAAQYQNIPEGPHRYDNAHLTHYYQRLAEDINNIWR